MPQNAYEAVVISGGGSKGIFSLGALQYEYEKGNYVPECTRIYSGTSIGAIISLLLVCGYTPMEIFVEIHKSQTFINTTFNKDIFSLSWGSGMLTMEPFIKLIEKLVMDKLCCDKTPTLKELNDLTGKVLVITGSNITKLSCEYYTYKSRPDLNCIDACRLSTNLPFIFQQIKYNDCYISDGGLVDNFPLKYIDDGKMKILGIVSLGNDFSPPDSKLYGYFYRLIIMPMEANTKLRCDLASSNTKLIKINTDNFSMIPIQLSEEKKMEMFLGGYNHAEEFDKIEYIYVSGWKDDVHTI